MLLFGQYLKQCREQIPLSQRQLVNRLNDYDDIFQSLDNTTLSRWERSINLPSLIKQTRLTAFIAEQYQRLFPFIAEQPYHEIAKLLHSQFFCCSNHQSQLVVKCPIDQIDHRDFIIHPINSSAHQTAAINHNLHIYSQIHRRQLSLQQHQQLSQLAANTFLVCDYYDQYLGHLFLLKLTQQSYQQIINFERPESSLNKADIAPAEEPGYYYIFGLFSLGIAVASLLICHLYALLIKNQFSIKGIGWLTHGHEQRDWAVQMGMQPALKSSTRNQGLVYQADLQTVLCSERLMKLLFKR
ncbi:helix-turn-helix domain-containing protein [Thiomicrorhabdus sediminis]|uniref:Uncharacterized protein n=1 Tax=Thiomicrorhabdus sediminis TaxID=2580412 RepID=A0A4P9K7G9_9GAMM|nr:hypothetical protein [Thiomicrorhabdus sediminis]QCU91052.1 hypothetical protein FE785_10690 [Thiomicrorhabdus sediminis]